MSYVKIAGLLTAVAVALMALASTASATTVTNESGGTTPTIHMVNENGHLTIHSYVNIECPSTAQGIIQSHGSGSTASGILTSLSFAPCTNSWHVTPSFTGSLEIHYVSPGVGTLTSSGMTIVTTRTPVTCTYITKNTDLGSITDSSITGGGATIHLEGFLQIHAGSSGLCGQGAAAFEGNYVTTEKLFIDS